MDETYRILDAVYAKKRQPGCGPAQYLMTLLRYVFGTRVRFHPTTEEAKLVKPAAVEDPYQPPSPPVPTTPHAIRKEQANSLEDAAMELIQVNKNILKMSITLDNLRARKGELKEIILNEDTLVAGSVTAGEHNATWIGKMLLTEKVGDEKVERGISPENANLALWAMGFQYPSNSAWVPYASYNTPEYCRLAVRENRGTSSDRFQSWHMWTLAAQSLMVHEWEKVRGTLNWSELREQKVNFRMPSED